MGPHAGLRWVLATRADFPQRLIALGGLLLASVALFATCIGLMFTPIFIARPSKFAILVSANRFPCFPIHHGMAAPRVVKSSVVKHWHIVRLTLVQLRTVVHLPSRVIAFPLWLLSSTRPLQRTASGEWRPLFRGCATHDLSSHRAICIGPFASIMRVLAPGRRRRAYLNPTSRPCAMAGITRTC